MFDRFEVLTSVYSEDPSLSYLTTCRWVSSFSRFEVW